MKLRPFELVLVVIFIFFIFGSLLFLSLYKPNPESKDGPQIGEVVIWGTLPREPMEQLLSQIGQIDKRFQAVSYRFIPEQEFDTTLTNALADQAGPDIIILSHDRLVDYRRRIRPVSYESFPPRDIRNLYIDGAQIFALRDGLYAYPLFVNPLMMYWNRDLLANKGFLEPPKTWEELVNVQLTALVERNQDRTIVRSVVAFGEVSNVRNAFATVSMLLIQAGSQGVEDSERGYLIRLAETPVAGINPLLSSVDFYARFAQPANTLYSWNRSFTEDRAQFVSEDLLLYFGFANEGREIEQLNPNLNFDIAEVPQGAAATVRRTYGTFYGLALLQASRNPAGAQLVIQELTKGENVSRLAEQYSLVPAYRSLVAVGSNDIYGRVAYKSASIAFSWLNPRKVRTEQLFDTMVRDINENRRPASDASSDFITRLRMEYN